MQKEEKYLKTLLNFLFDQFDQKSGAVGDIEVYKAPELDFVEQSEKIADVFFNTDEFEPDEQLRQLYENEWMSASQVFDYLAEELPNREVSHEMILSYDTTGMTGSFTSYNLFTWTNKAIFYETADGFTPGIYKIQPVDSNTDLTTFSIAYFLKKGFPQVDLFSLELNSNWISKELFQKVLVDKLKKWIESANRRILTENFREMVNGYTEEGLRSRIKEKDQEVIFEFLEGQCKELQQEMIGAIVAYIFVKCHQ